jgi:flagellar biosynthesis/type III secretory pathway ATPase
MQEERSTEQLLLDVQRLSAEVENLKRQKADLEILLETTTEHSDTMEAQLLSKAQWAQSSSKEQFRARSSATPVPVLVSRLCDGLILYANAQLASLVPTAGVTRGEIVSDRQQPLQVPVGDRLLGRMLNLFGFFGEAIDRKEPIAGGEWRSIHAEPIAMSEGVTKA